MLSPMMLKAFGAPSRLMMSVPPAELHRHSIHRWVPPVGRATAEDELDLVICARAVTGMAVHHGRDAHIAVADVWYEGEAVDAVQSPQDWSIHFDTGARGRQTLVRQGPLLWWSGPAAGERRFELSPPTLSAASRQAIDDAHARATQQFPRFRTREPQRAQASALLAALGLAGCAVVAGAAARLPRRLSTIWWAMNLAWAAAVAYLLHWLAA